MSDDNLFRIASEPTIWNPDGEPSYLTNEALNKAIDYFSRQEIQPNQYFISAGDWYFMADEAIELGLITDRNEFSEEWMWRRFVLLKEYDRFEAYLVSSGWRPA